MKHNTTLSGLIFLASQTDNTFLVRRLEELKELIETTPNSFELGEKIRRLL